MIAHANQGRTPPRDLEAERGVLGSMLLDQGTLDSMAGILRPADFYLADNGEAYAVALDLHQTGVAVDAVTVFDRLQAKSPREDEVYWRNLLLNAIENTPHAGHARYHAKIVAEKARRRNVGYALSECLADVYREDIDTDELLSRVASAVHGQLERGVSGQAATLTSILAEVLEELDRPQAPGVATGFRPLDRLIRPEAGQLIVVAARPSVGKTSLMLAIAENVARHFGPVLVVSQEMTRGELARRMLSAACRVDVPSLRGIVRNDNQRPTLLEQADILGGLPLLIDDTPNRRVSDIESVARLLRRQGGLSLICIDYLQILTPDNPKAPTEAQISQMSRACKMLAKSVEVPVVLLSQLNRAMENREDRRPRLADLRSSGAIEQDADVVIFLDRPHLWDAEADPTDAVVSVGKNRHGELGELKLKWDGPTMTFKDPPAPAWPTAESWSPDMDGDFGG